jgi:hypothetical protein
MSTENELKIDLLHKIDGLLSKGLDIYINVNMDTSIEVLTLEYAKLQKMYYDKEIETYSHIVKYWKEEYYKKCKADWVKLQEFILPENFSSGYVCKCGTRWCGKRFINPMLNICCYCDTLVQPYLSNPLNKINVLKYIPEKYHNDILIEYKCISCKKTCVNNTCYNNTCDNNSNLSYYNIQLCLDCINQIEKNKIHISPEQPEVLEETNDK